MKNFTTYKVIGVKGYTAKISEILVTLVMSLTFLKIERIEGYLRISKYKVNPEEYYLNTDAFYTAIDISPLAPIFFRQNPKKIILKEFAPHSSFFTNNTRISAMPPYQTYLDDVENFEGYLE